MKYATKRRGNMGGECIYSLPNYTEQVDGAGAQTNEHQFVRTSKDRVGGLEVPRGDDRTFAGRDDEEATIPYITGETNG